MNGKEKDSLFNRWKAQSSQHDNILEGITAEEMEEYTEAFKLFDKVFLCIIIPPNVHMTLFEILKGKS